MILPGMVGCALGRYEEQDQGQFQIPNELETTLGNMRAYLKTK